LKTNLPLWRSAYCSALRISTLHVDVGFIQPSRLSSKAGLRDVLCRKTLPERR
jgi:hypothetical protein